MAPRMKVESAQPAAQASTATSKKTAKATVTTKVASVAPQVEATPQAAPAASAPKKRTAKVVVASTEQPKAAQPKAAAKPKAQKAPKVVPAPARTYDDYDYAATPQQGVAEEPVQDAEASKRRGLAGATDSVAGWVSRTFPGHEHAFWGAVLALVVALMVFAIGIWRVLFIALLVVVGIAAGQALDGDPKIIAAIRELFASDRGQE